MKKYLVTTALTLALPFAVATNASAQIMDYGTMEEMFGEPVTTSANGSPQRSSDVALNMEILTADDIEKSGARNLTEALRFLPGVDVRQHSFGQTEVGIRGYNQASSERILVLVNGRQVYTDYFGQAVWENIPVELAEIQQIEVVKGPNTALFGFNAVSGVINIVTTNPLYSDKKQVTLRGGTHDLREITGVVNHKLTDDTAIKLSAGGYMANDEFDDMTAGNRAAAAVKPERRSAAIDIWSQLTDNVQMQVEFTTNTNKRNEVVAIRRFSGTEYDARSARGRILADTDWGMIEADIYHNTVTTDYQFALPSVVAPLFADNQITVAKLNDTFEAGNDHIFRIGGEYRTASHNFSSSMAPLDQGDMSYEIFSGSGLWDWRATDKLRTSVALRYDNFELSPDGSFVSPAIQGMYGAFGLPAPFSTADYNQKREEISYNVGAVYKADEVNTFRASTARGADLPSFVEFGLQFVLPDADGNPFDPTFDTLALLGSPTIDTSIVTNYELGYDRKIEDIEGIFRAAVFYQTNEDMQGFGARVTDFPALDEAFIGNFGDSDMYGLELGLEGKYDENLGWFANYTLVKVDDKLNNSQNAFPYSSPILYEDAVSNHTFNLGFNYASDDWRAGIAGQYKTAFDDLRGIAGPNNAYALEEVSDVFIANANAAYDLNDHLTWHVSGTSITGKTQQYVEGDAEAVVWTGIDIKF